MNSRCTFLWCTICWRNAKQGHFVLPTDCDGSGNVLAQRDTNFGVRNTTGDKMGHQGSRAFVDNNYTDCFPPLCCPFLLIIMTPMHSFDCSYPFQYTSSLPGDWGRYEYDSCCPGICHRHPTRSSGRLRWIWTSSWSYRLRSQVSLYSSAIVIIPRSLLSFILCLGLKYREGFQSLGRRAYIETIYSDGHVSLVFLSGFVCRPKKGRRRRVVRAFVLSISTGPLFRFSI